MKEYDYVSTLLNSQPQNRIYLTFIIPKDLGNNLLTRFLELYTFGSKNLDQLPTTLPEINQLADTQSKSNAFNFIICFIGLQVSFLSWGIMQERIIKYEYESLLPDEPTARFENTQFLVLANRTTGLLISSIIMIMFKRPAYKNLHSLQRIVSAKNWAPLFICSYSSLSNVLSSCFQYEALKYVSFTTQLLAKSSKSVFVMITGRIVMKKNYKSSEYVCVLLISVGIFLFSDVTSMSSANHLIQTTLPGLICLLGYLVSDSFTSTWQDNLISTYSMSSMALMFMTNFYSSIYTLSSLVYQGQLYESIEFVSTHSMIASHICLFSMASAIGQIFIFVTIQKFGALIFTLIMTTRQLLAIFFSSIIFEHALSVQSMLGIGLIFLALFSKQLLSLSNKYRKKVQPIILK